MSLQLNRKEIIRRNNLLLDLKVYYPLILHEQIYNNLKVYTNDFLQNLLLSIEVQSNPLDNSDQQFKKTYLHLQNDHAVLWQRYKKQVAQRLMMPQQHRCQQNGYDNPQYSQQQRRQNYPQQNYRQRNYPQQNYLHYLQKVKNANEVDKAKRQIVYNLNLLTLENVKDIMGDLQSYLYDNQDICKFLIQKIIQKALLMPKYSKIYAKICYSFAKKNASSFKFKHQAQQGDQQQKQQQKTEKRKFNPFKRLLIEQIQQNFCRQQQSHAFKDNDQKDNYLKTKKMEILGNVKFIAYLIKIKVINKKVAKLVILELLYNFLVNYNLSRSNPNEFKYSFYDYYMEAIIEFIQILSKKFEQLDDPQGVYVKYAKILQYVTSLINGQKNPESKIGEFIRVKIDDYFKLFLFIDSQILAKKNNRLSCLLKNLQERRQKKWQKYYPQSQVPKKLTDIKDDIAREQQQTTVMEKKSKKQLQKLDYEMKILLKSFQEGETYNKQYQNIVKTHDSEDIIMSYLKLVAQAKKDQIAKRVNLFDFMLERKEVNIEVFKKHWPKAISTLAFLSSDLPFCGAVMAKLLIKIDEKRGIIISDFYVKFDEQQQEDKKYFMDEIFNKWFFYTKKEDIKQFVGVSSSCSGMI